MPGVVSRNTLLLVGGEVLAGLGGNIEGLFRQTERLAGAIDEFRPAFAVRLRSPCHLGNAFADEGTGNDQLRFAGGGFCLLKRLSEGRQVVAIHGLHRPLKRLKTLGGVLVLRGDRHGVEGNVVGIVNDDQVVQMRVTGERHGFLGHAFLHAAVPGERDDVLIENRVLRRVKPGCRHLGGHGVPDRI